jgi:hypothetical protein
MRLAASRLAGGGPLSSNVRPHGNSVSTTIRFQKLYTYTADATDVRLPLSALAAGAHHVHGQLEIIISGRPLPALGYVGSDDVCLNTWTGEFCSVLAALRDTQESKYIFDEGEQGQPAYMFAREGDVLYVSVVDSKLSGARGSPNFQQVSCTWEVFREAVTEYLSALRKALEAEAPDYAATWFRECASAA